MAIPPISRRGVKAVEAVSKSAFDQAFSARFKKVNETVLGPAITGAVKDNFDQGGVPSFTPNSKMTLFMKHFKGYSSYPLLATGELYQKAIQNPVIKATENSLELSPRNVTTRLRKSMWALHEGYEGQLQKTPKMRRFFWYMSSKAKEMGDTDMSLAFRKMALSGKTSIDIKIPARPWLKFTDAQVKNMEQLLGVAYTEAVGDLFRLRMSQVGLGGS